MYWLEKVRKDISILEKKRNYFLEESIIKVFFFFFNGSFNDSLIEEIKVFGSLWQRKMPRQLHLFVHISMSPHNMWVLLPTNLLRPWLPSQILNKISLFCNILLPSEFLRLRPSPSPLHLTFTNSFFSFDTFIFVCSWCPLLYHIILFNLVISA